MTINQTLGQYELITDESDGSQIVVRHLPTGKEVVLNQGDVDADDRYLVAGSQVVASRQGAVGKLTDNTGGTADGTLAAVSGSGADAAINNNLAELNAKLDALIDVLGASAGHGLTQD